VPPASSTARTVGPTAAHDERVGTITLQRGAVVA
jgi:hypothetical protein